MQGDEKRVPLRFVVTVDTEADDAWSRPAEVRMTNMEEIGRFQDLCDKYEVVPTYLIAYECATRDEALSVLVPVAQSRPCEIGHHLHVWTAPPFEDESPSGIDRKWLKAFQFQLPDTLFEEKAEALRHAIEMNFGRSPTAHRAGKWGIDQRTVNWLIRNGFIAETSLRSSFRLLTKDGLTGKYTPQINPFPWSDSTGDQGYKPLIELPATVDMPDELMPRLLRQGMALDWPAQSLCQKAYRSVGGLRMLRPHLKYPPGELPRIIERAIAQGVTVVNLMLHSSELRLHCSPFTRTESGLKSIWSHLEEAFRYIRACNIKSEGISNVARLVRA